MLWQNILLDYCKKSNNHQDIYNFIMNEDISDKLIIETILNLSKNINLCDLLRNCLKNNISDAKYDRLIDPYKLKNLCKIQDYHGVKEYISVCDITEYDIKDSFEIISRQTNPDLSILDLFISHPLWNIKLQNEIILNLINFDSIQAIKYITQLLDITMTGHMAKICIYFDKYDIFEFMIQFVNNTHKFINEHHLLHYISSHTDNRFFDLLLDLGGNINDDILLYLAISDNNKYYVKKLIEYGNWLSNCDYVNMAIRNCNSDILDILLGNNFIYDLDSVKELIKNIDNPHVNDIINILSKYNIYVSLT
nr:hypothetical protein [Megavirus caiporensis]